MWAIGFLVILVAAALEGCYRRHEEVLGDRDEVEADVIRKLDLRFLELTKIHEQLQQEVATLKSELDSRIAHRPQPELILVYEGFVQVAGLKIINSGDADAVRVFIEFGDRR